MDLSVFANKLFIFFSFFLWSFPVQRQQPYQALLSQQLSNSSSPIGPPPGYTANPPPYYDNNNCSSPVGQQPHDTSGQGSPQPPMTGRLIDIDNEPPVYGATAATPMQTRNNAPTALDNPLHRSCRYHTHCRCLLTLSVPFITNHISVLHKIYPVGLTERVRKYNPSNTSKHFLICLSISNLMLNVLLRCLKLVFGYRLLFLPSVIVLP